MSIGGLAAGLAVSVLLLAPAAGARQASGRYAVRDLGTLGGTLSAAADVNARGQVAGVSMTSAGYLHAFLWTNGRIRDLGTLGGDRSYATALNDAGAVAGYSKTAAGATHAFLWKRHTGMRDLGTLGGADSFAADVNDVGVVVGRSLDALDTPRGFVWTKRGGMRPLAGDPFSVASAVGAGPDGPIGGSAGLPFLPGAWAQPGAPFAGFVLPQGFDQGQTYGLDARGDAVGAIGRPDGSAQAFFRPRGEPARPLPRPGGYAEAEAYSVSNSLRIAGSAYDNPFAETAGWLARSPSGPVRLLSQLAPGTSWSFGPVSSVNDLGQLAGTGVTGHRTHAYLLTPPAGERAASLRAFALGGAGLHRRVAHKLRGALRNASHHRRARACRRLRKLAAAARHERSLAPAVRKVFAADVRGFALLLSCRV